MNLPSVTVSSMSTDARLMITGFTSLEEATAAADAARPTLMGQTRLSALGTHHAVDRDATCWGLDAYTDVSGLVLVEAASPLRWKPNPLDHAGLADFIATCVRQFPSKDFFWTGDETAAQLRYNDTPFAHALASGHVQALLTVP